MLVHQAGTVLYSRLMATENQTSTDRLLLLHQIATVMQGTLDLRQLFHVILSACTAGEGLGFNRAFLFLVDRERNCIVGRLAVGPESHEDCARIWGSLGQRRMSPEEFVASLNDVRDLERTELTARVREVAILLRSESGILARTVLERRAFLVHDAETDVRVNAQLRAALALQQFASIPLVARGEVEGVLLVDNRFNQRPLTEDDLKLLSVLAAQASVAIRNARLYEQIERMNEALEERVAIATADLQRRAQQLALLHDIDVAILAQREPGEILYLVVERAVELCHATCGAILLVDEEEKSLEVQAVRTTTDSEYSRQMLQVGEWVANEVAVKGEPRCVDNNDPLGKALFCSILAVPMVFGKKLVGVIHLERPSPTRFDENDQEVLTMLARAATLVLHNARMYEDVERRFREVASLSEVQQAILSSFDLNELLALIVRKAVEVVPGAVACVIRLSEDGGASMVRAASFVMPGSSLTESDLEQVEAFLSTRPRDQKISTVRCSNFNVVTVPLEAQRDVIGMMHVYWATTEFDTREHPTLMGFASQAASAIQNVRLYRNLVQSYRDLKQAQAALTQKEKMAVLGEMAAMVAHEIRNPLTTIRGFSQRIGALIDGEIGERSIQRIKRYSTFVVNEVDRLNRVVSDVLNFARRSRTAFAPTDINELVREVLHMEEGTIQSNGIVLAADLAPNLPLVTCDRNQVKQVLINLIQNAIQAVSQGGAIEVSTRATPTHARIAVKDTGCGIAPQALDAIFQPFYTTKATGTGLGLSLAKRVVEEDHRGTLEVQSQLGEGSTFTVALPLRNCQRVEEPDKEHRS